MPAEAGALLDVASSHILQLPQIYEFHRNERKRVWVTSWRALFHSSTEVLLILLLLIWFMPSRLRSGSKFGPAGIIGTFELGKFARNKTAKIYYGFHFDGGSASRTIRIRLFLGGQNQESGNVASNAEQEIYSWNSYRYEL